MTAILLYSDLEKTSQCVGLNWHITSFLFFLFFFNFQEQCNKYKQTNKTKQKRKGKKKKHIHGESTEEEGKSIRYILYIRVNQGLQFFGNVGVPDSSKDQRSLFATLLA